MNTKEMATVLDSIIQLSHTIDVIETQKCPTPKELVVYNKVRRVFLNLMEMSIEPHGEIEVYEFNREKESFELVAN